MSTGTGHNKVFSGDFDRDMMRRALQLAANGAGYVSPNPMVGAVIVAEDGRIIGQGWHRKYGGPHAEVQAFRSVRPRDERLLSEATIYVTLEPCSHYGKTPPCAKLIVDKGVRRVVVGCGDPNPKVSGRGIEMIRQAGIEVTENILRDECVALNKRFMTAHTLHRPWIQLKWAEDAQGNMARRNTDYTPGSGLPEYLPMQISSPVGMVLMHGQRAMVDAIMAGTNTLLSDNPSLTARLWPGNSPRPVIFRSSRLTDSLKIWDRDPIILDPAIPLEQNMHLLFSEHGITSLMVEGGRTLLDSFIEKNLYDEMRVESKIE